ncbi:MAG: tRNA (adenosine(37)-N6)-threonylcarbamoyltransferase complex dimerization subunit type 1 TsaB [Rickettsiales bacterium]|nr:tRNA (adenosine(37)-N6)-threonylcarbamoyltransferase complex dimerization subunit type 1 TsaB [Rickettsiales bacterium]
MLSLLVNTTSPYPEISFFYQNEVFEFRSDVLNSHSQNLIIMLDKFLVSENLNVSDVDDVYIIVGPGSYTGIRVGISFVLGLKLASSLNVIPVTIFDAVCLTFKEQDSQSLLMLIDSKKNDEYFFSAIDVGKNDENIGVVKKEDIKNLVVNYDKFLLIGDSENEFDENKMLGLTPLKVKLSAKKIFNYKDSLKALHRPLEPFYIKNNIFNVK